MSPITSIALALGVLSHIFYFRSGEHQFLVTFYLRLVLITPLALAMSLSYLLQQRFLGQLRLVVIAELQYIIGVYLTMVFYRVSPLHRLSVYPGPLAYRVSKLAHAYQNRNFKNYQNLYSTHQTYGDYVRTGPSELSIIDPDAIEPILASSSNCKRAAWYAMAHPLKAIFHTTDRGEHEKRRRVWSDGFSTNNLKAYETRIETHISRLMRKIDRVAADGQPLNVSLWLNYFSFDVMGEVGFGRAFGMLETGEKLAVLKILEGGQKGLGVFGVVPWLFMLLTKLPWISAEHNVFVKWCETQILDRKKVSMFLNAQNES